MPRVTIIIATWNWSRVLPYSIGSVLDQTMTDFELLVVGDGCTDDSERVVTSIADPRVRWINLPAHSGHQSEPNNEGLRQARGEFIAYLGHDDLWLPHHLEVLSAALDRGADLAHTLVAIVAPDGTRTIGSASRMPPSSLMHRRSVTEAIGGWRDYRELSVPPDRDLRTRIRAAGYRIELVPRLTAVKFPAAWRRDVYRARPCHEQAEWLARIRSEPDLEVVELARIALRQKPRFLDRLIRFLSMPSLWISSVWRRRGARINAFARFKGADPHASRGPEGSTARHE